MVLVDKENVKGYVQMDEKEHTKKEYASKGLAGTALGLGIGGLAVSLLNNGCNPLGIFGRNCGTNAGEVAIAANEQYLERKQCADFVELVNGMWQKAYDAQKARQDDRNVLNAELFSIYSAMRVDKVSTFVSEKLNEVLDSNPFSFIIKPYVSRVANNYIGKLDGLLKAIEDKDGKVDIEGILSESIDNLVVAQVKKYPNVFSGVEIGGGTIKINIPSFDKQLVFDYNDIETFKQNILN